MPNIARAQTPRKRSARTINLEGYGLQCRLPIPKRGDKSMAKWKLTSTMKCPTPIKEQLDFVQRLSFSQLHRAMIGVLGTSKAWEIKTEDYQWTTA